MPTVGRYGSPQALNRTAKMYIRPSAIQKIGMEKVIKEIAVRTLSSVEYWCRAEYTPMNSEKMMISISAVIIRVRVFGMRSTTTSIAGWRVTSELPKSPRNTPLRSP